MFADDGEFYMGFRDFLKYFGLIEICHLPPERSRDGGDRSLLQSFTGSWRPGHAGGSGRNGQIGGGGKTPHFTQLVVQYVVLYQSFVVLTEKFASNPQHFIDLHDANPFDGEDVCPVVISLAQRQEYGKPFHHIGFKVYACPRDRDRIDARYMRRNAPVRGYTAMDAATMLEQAPCSNHHYYLRSPVPATTSTFARSAPASSFHPDATASCRPPTRPTGTGTTCSGCWRRGTGVCSGSPSLKTMQFRYRKKLVSFVRHK